MMYEAYRPIPPQIDNYQRVPGIPRGNPGFIETGHVSGHFGSSAHSSHPQTFTSPSHVPSTANEMHSRGYDYG
eukprot:1350161-Amorphochlora_amoeboformis.AAC.1